MNAQELEAFLARLYTDDALRAAFLTAPAEVARKAGLREENVDALERIDREGLKLAAHSYSHKRAEHAGKRTSRGILAGFFRTLG